MQTKVKTWGNSLSIRIPKHISDEANIHEGSDVYIKLKRRTIVIYPLKQSPLNLEEMASRITKQNRHHEELVDKRHGREIW